MALRGVAAGAGSGVLLWLASPAVGAGWLAWVALVPAAAAALAWPRERAARAAVPVAYAVYLELLLVPALPFGLAEGQWNHAPVSLLIGGSPVLPVALVVVPLFAVLLYALRFGQAPGSSALTLVAVPALSWTALDFARASLDPGGLFGPLYLSQHDTAAARAAALAGPWLLTFAIVATGYALALAVVRGRRATAGLAAAAVIAGALVAAEAGPRGGGGGLTVAVVQPGYDTAEEDRPELRFFQPGTYGAAALDTIRDLAPLTREAARRGARVVVWPEAAVWVDPAADPLAGAALRRLAGEAGAAIVVPRFLNRARAGAAVIVTSDGRIGRAAPKQRPMWFLGEERDEAESGEPLEAGAATVGTLLGVDSQAPALAGGLADRGADLLASSTHDWEALATHQRAAAQLHAAATGVALARADWRYGSAIYDAGGRRLADAGEGRRRTVVIAEVEAAPAATPYARVGDLVAWLSVAGVTLAWFAAAPGLRRARRPAARGAGA